MLVHIAKYIPRKLYIQMLKAVYFRRNLENLYIIKNLRLFKSKVAVQAQEGLKELLHVQGQEGWW